MAKRRSGLYLRDGVWHIDKQARGRRICASTGTGDFKEAEAELDRRISEIRREVLKGERPRRTFEQAAALFIKTEANQKDFYRFARGLRIAMPYIGHLELGEIHYGSLLPMVEDRKRQGISMATLNRDLSPVKKVLLVAATQWFHENGQPWLNTIPFLPHFSVTNVDASVRALTMMEQRAIFQHLSAGFAEKSLFAVNTRAHGLG
jgi:hypothetical protein